MFGLGVAEVAATGVAAGASVAAGAGVALACERFLVAGDMAGEASLEGLAVADSVFLWLRCDGEGDASAGEAAVVADSAAGEGEAFDLWLRCFAGEADAAGVSLGAGD
jgi:hypothetical protein